MSCLTVWRHNVKLNPRWRDICIPICKREISGLSSPLTTCAIFNRQKQTVRFKQVTFYIFSILVKNAIFVRFPNRWLYPSGTNPCKYHVHTRLCGLTSLLFLAEVIPQEIRLLQREVFLPRFAKSWKKRKWWVKVAVVKGSPSKFKFIVWGFSFFIELDWSRLLRPIRLRKRHVVCNFCSKNGKDFTF